MIEMIKGSNETLRKTKSRDSWEYYTSIDCTTCVFPIDRDDKVNVVNWEQIFTVYIPNWE